MYKKNTAMFPFIVIIILLNSVSLFCQWEEIGPCGGWITCMKSLPDDPDKIFCGVLQGGAYYSTDRGEHWNLIQEIGEQNPVYDISISPRGIIYIGSLNGLYKSDDLGQTWRKILAATTWQVIALNDTVVTADAIKSGYALPTYRRRTNAPWQISTNSGQQWEFWEGTFDSSLSSYHSIYPHEKRGDMVTANDGSVYRTQGLKIYKTDAANWNQWIYLTTLDEWMYNMCFAFLAKSDSDSTLYAYVEDYDYHPVEYFYGGVFKTTDEWQNWIKLSNSRSASAMSVKGANIFYGQTDGVANNTSGRLILYNTKDDNIQELGRFGGDIIEIDAVRWDQGELIIATEAGIFKTIDSGETWINSNDGIHHTSVVAVQTIPQNDKNERIVIAVHKGGIFTSENFGATWDNVDRNSYVLPGLLKNSPQNPQYIFAGGSELFRSSNGGNSWQAIPRYEFPASYYAEYARAADIVFDPHDAKHLIVHFDDHSMDDYRGVVFAVSNDFGDTWETKNWFKQEWNYSKKAAFDSVKNRLWISRDDDASEIPAFLVIDYPPQDTSSVVLPRNLGASFWCVNGDTCFAVNTKVSKFFRSDDFGQTWFEKELTNLKYSHYWQDWAVQELIGQLILSPNKKQLFFIYPGTGALFSSDRGETWKTFNEGLPTLNTYHLTFSTVNPAIAYLATENGLYKMDVVTSVEWEHGTEQIKDIITKPENFIICNNYPNPFNAITTITCRVQAPGKLTVTVYDLLGREIQKIADKKNVKQEMYYFQWDAGKNPSGAYFLKTSLGEVSVTNKMLLIQ